MQHEYFDDILKKLQKAPGHRETAEPVKVGTKGGFSSHSLRVCRCAPSGMHVCESCWLLGSRFCPTSRQRWRLWRDVRPSSGLRQRQGNDGDSRRQGRLQGKACR